jgi:hypothetical protein
MLEDYRAGLSIDREHEEAAKHSSRTVGCPTQLLSSTRDSIDICTVIRALSGTLGPTTCTANRSSPDITSPKRNPMTSRQRCTASSNHRPDRFSIYLCRDPRFEPTRRGD